MLVLSRRVQEEISIGDGVIVTLAEIDRNKVRIGFTAPRGVPIYRRELTAPAVWDGIIAVAAGRFPSAEQVEIANLKRLALALAARCAGQSELLTRRAAPVPIPAVLDDAAFGALTAYAEHGDVEQLDLLAAGLSL